MSRLTKKRRFVPLLVCDDYRAGDGDFGDGDTPGGGAGGGGYLLGEGDFLEMEDDSGNVLIEEGGSTLINDLTEATEVDPTDLAYLVNDFAGGPASRKITIQDVLDSMINLDSGALTADESAETPIILDPSGTPVPRAVTLSALYDYLLLLGAVLPDGFQCRTHGGSNTGVGSQGQFNGPGYWTNGLAGETVQNPANNTDDMLVTYANNRYMEGQTTFRMDQYPVFQFVGRWREATNRYTVAWNNGAFDGFNADLPAQQYIGFHTYYNEQYWRLIIHDGTSVVLNQITTELVDQQNSDYELKIVATDTPSIQFWIRGSMYYEETVNLPNFNLGMYPFVGVGNSSAVSWISPKMVNVIATRY